MCTSHEMCEYEPVVLPQHLVAPRLSLILWAARLVKVSASIRAGWMPVPPHARFVRKAWWFYHCLLRRERVRWGRDIAQRGAGVG